MAGIESLKERLLNDAKSKALEIENEAQSKAVLIIDEAKQKAEKIVEEYKEKAEREGKEKKERIISKAKMEVRDLILKEKQNVIDNVFKGVIDRINQMDLVSYKKFIKKLILNNVEFGDEEIILSQRDKEKFDQNFIEELNRELISKGKVGNLKLSNEVVDINSGFILRRKGLEINCTIEALIRNLRDDLEAELVRFLF